MAVQFIGDSSAGSYICNAACNANIVFLIILLLPVPACRLF
jgi:hypothetical protein